MKKEGIIVSLVLSIIGFSFFVSAFSADLYHFTSDFNCTNFGIECGTGIII